MTASSSASWSRFSPPSNVVNGHVSTMWFMVCRWPQSQEGDWVRPHLCKLARHGPWPVRKRFIIRDHVWRGRLKPGCQTVGSVTIVWLQLRVLTEVDVSLSQVRCSLRQDVVWLLLSVVDQPSPNLAHFLLGFDIRKPISRTTLQDPGTIAKCCSFVNGVCHKISVCFEVL